MKKKVRRVLVAAGLGVALLIPAGTALAAGNQARNPDHICTGNQDMDRIRARDGTGWRHTTADGTMVEVQPGAGYQHRGGPMDGTGQGQRPADGTGYQWRGGQAS